MRPSPATTTLNSVDVSNCLQTWTDFGATCAKRHHALDPNAERSCTGWNECNFRLERREGIRCDSAANGHASRGGVCQDASEPPESTHSRHRTGRPQQPTG